MDARELLTTYKLKQLTPFVFNSRGEPVTYRTIQNMDKKGEFEKILIGHRKPRCKRDGTYSPEYAYIHPKLTALIRTAYRQGYFEKQL